MTRKHKDPTAFERLLAAIDPCYKPTEFENKVERLMVISEAQERLKNIQAQDGEAGNNSDQLRNEILDFLQSFLNAAYEYHETTGIRSDLKAALFLKKLGVSTGKNKKTRSGHLIVDYVWLINPGPDYYPADPTSALESLAAMHGLESPEAALQQLRTHIRKMGKRAEAKGEVEGFKKFVEGLHLPGNPPWPYKK
ncbi:MAG: hypothetical protein AB1724_12235 [Thermodesulfobacteriota bacterium]